MAPRELGTVELFWIPLGAGARFVRFNGIVYEALDAARHRRPRRDLYHSALSIDLSHGRYMVEMTPVPDGRGAQRGVVAEGPVGMRSLGALRLFRYEVRRWREGVVPDLGHAVASPVRVTDDAATAQRIFDALPAVPTLTWGRDEAGAHDMWSCNSIISWTLEAAGVDVSTLAAPPNARAPGWDAGRAVARLVPPDARSAGRDGAHGVLPRALDLVHQLVAPAHHLLDRVGRDHERHGSDAEADRPPVAGRLAGEGAVQSPMST